MDSDGSQIICIILLIFFSTGKVFFTRHVSMQILKLTIQKSNPWRKKIKNIRGFPSLSENRSE